MRLQEPVIRVQAAWLLLGGAYFISLVDNLLDSHAGYADCFPDGKSTSPEAG